jgi:thiamine thiazole synthase
MSTFSEADISLAIIDAYHDRLRQSVDSDVVIIGAGPSGMTAAYYLAKSGRKVVVVEKRLSPGGGVWGGAMGMNVVAIQDDAVPILDDVGIQHQATGQALHIVDAAELACGLTLCALKAGAVLLNLTSLEDLSVHHHRIAGVVINRTTLLEALPVDPIALRTSVVLDATGHEAVAVEKLVRRGLISNLPAVERHREAPMDAYAGEAFVVDHVAEVFPGLWITGMSVCAVYGGPRMGPIFGGMIQSGRRAAELILGSLK